MTACSSPVRCSHGRGVAREGVPWLRLVRDRRRYEIVIERGRAIGPILNPGVAATLLAPELEAEDQEVALVLLVDVQGYARGVQEIARGSRDRVDVTFADMLRAGIVAGTPYIILAHNHPGGSSEPSSADDELTRDASAACGCVGMVLLDHLVFGMGEVYSFREGRTWQVKS